MKLKGYLSVCIIAFLFFGCSPDFLIIEKNAKILTINKNILSGELINEFLSSPSGNFSNDVIKVGIEIHICNHVFLEDLELQHAELAYYKDRTTLPLYISIINDFSTSVNYGKLTIKLNERIVKERFIPKHLAEVLIECNKMK